MKVGDLVNYAGKDCLVTAVGGPEIGSQVCLRHAGAYTWVNPSVVTMVKEGESDGSIGSESASEAQAGSTAEEPVASDDGSGDFHGIKL